MKYRIKEAATNRVWLEFENAVKPSAEAACAGLLATQIKAKRLGHLGSLQLQAWGRAGWTDVGAPQG